MSRRGEKNLHKSVDRLIRTTSKIIRKSAKCTQIKTFAHSFKFKGVLRKSSFGWGFECDGRSFSSFLPHRADSLVLVFPLLCSEAAVWRQIPRLFDAPPSSRCCGSLHSVIGLCYVHSLRTIRFPLQERGRKQSRGIVLIQEQKAFIFLPAAVQEIHYSLSAGEDLLVLFKATAWKYRVCSYTGHYS